MLLALTFLRSRSLVVHQESCSNPVWIMKTGMHCACCTCGAIGVLCSTAIGFVLCRVDIGQHAARNFYEAICNAAEGIDVDIAMVGGASRHILINAQNYPAWPYLMLNF